MESVGFCGCAIRRAPFVAASKHYATRLALQQPYANFGFQITNLPAQGRL